MANEIFHNHTTDATLYFCAFQLDGNVFLTGGASDEVWGTDGRDADDYDRAIADYNTAIDLYPGDDGDDLAYSYRASAYLVKGCE